MYLSTFETLTSLQGSEGPLSVRQGVRVMARVCYCYKKKPAKEEGRGKVSVMGSVQHKTAAQNTTKTRGRQEGACWAPRSFSERRPHGDIGVLQPPLPPPPSPPPPPPNNAGPF